MADFTGITSKLATLETAYRSDRRTFLYANPTVKPLKVDGTSVLLARQLADHLNRAPAQETPAEFAERHALYLRAASMAG